MIKFKTLWGGELISFDNSKPEKRVISERVRKFKSYKNRRVVSR